MSFLVMFSEELHVCFLHDTLTQILSLYRYLEYTNQRGHLQ